MDNILIYNKILTLPKEMLSELDGFIDYLKSKAEKKQKKKPSFGSGKGLFVIKNDFDKPLDDFSEYM